MVVIVQNRLFFHDWIPTELLSTALYAPEPRPYGIELVHGSFHKSGVISQDTGLEVAAGLAFHAEASTGEVGGADVCHLQVEDDDFEMDARAKGAFHARNELRIPVEVFTEVRSGLFSVD